MMKLSACFTGHRSISEERSVLEQQLYSVLEQMVNEQGVTVFYAGGAYGFDAVASLSIIRLRDTYPQIQLHLILPCSYSEQTADWTQEQKAELQHIIGLSDSTEYVSEHKTANCMKIRNARLIELATICCICYWNPNDRRSGTGQTVRMAQRKGIQVINLYEK